MRTSAAKIRLVKEAANPWYEVTLIEGRNRQIRRMFEEVGHHVEKIKRVKYGPLALDVPPGKFRPLTTQEVDRLRTVQVALPTLQGNQGMKGSEDVLFQHMKAQNMTFAEVAETRGRSRELVGTPEMVADRLQEIFESGVCDGFVVSPVNHPGMFEQFCRGVVPELQRRGLFRKDYTGKTLRETLRG